jgi:sulfite reductase (ferredoxin)
VVPIQAHSEVEKVKVDSRGLYHPVADDLGDPQPCFGKDATHILKHHGVYQQDNRDSRASRKREGRDPDHRMMVRLKLPGGRVTADQYLLCDQLADRYGQGDMRVTSRQGLQFHGVHKHDLRPIIHDLNRIARLTTLGSAGDVARNVIAPPVADIDLRYGRHGALLPALSETISRHFSPKTAAYSEIWSDDQRARIHTDGTVTFVSGRTAASHDEPLYGGAYLPRKFKIALATDFDNAVDVYANDVGFIAVTDENGFSGFEVVVGGSLGHAHNRPDRVPGLASHFTFISQEEVIPLLEAIIKVFRDYGNRSDRHHARLRFLIETIGNEMFRDLVEKAAGRSFPPPRMMSVTGQEHYLGWSSQIQTGLNYVGIWLENGRIRDFDNGPKYKSALREAVLRFSPEIRFTPHHNIVLANIADAEVEALDALLQGYGIDVRNGVSPLRQWEMACPALPACPMALNESERAMPEIMRQLEKAVGMEVDVMIRMSGCSNSCSRPRMAEIGIIAKNSREYLVFVGGSRLGTRINALLLDDVATENLPAVLVALITLWLKERCSTECFGDWAYRIGTDALKRMLLPA